MEVAPGVHVDAEGKAFGPKLEEALACYADTLTLDAWANAGDRVNGFRSVRTLPGSPEYPLDPAGCRIILLHYNAPLQSWRARPGHIFHAMTLGEARRAAADAIRNGRVPSSKLREGDEGASATLLRVLRDAVSIKTLDAVPASAPDGWSWETIQDDREPPSTRMILRTHDDAAPVYSVRHDFRADTPAACRALAARAIAKGEV